jgi:hypothetical protein
VLGSNLGLDAVYPDLGFSMFSSAPPGKWRYSTLIRPWPLPSKSFPIDYSPLILSSYRV